MIRSAMVLLAILFLTTSQPAQAATASFLTFWGQSAQPQPKMRHRQRYRTGRHHHRHVHRHSRRSGGATASISCLTGETRAVWHKLAARYSVQAISTCRPGARIAGTNRMSKHASGQAVDFRTANRAGAIAYLRTQGVFVMTYAHSSHIHFNVGQTGYSAASRRGWKKRKWRR